MLQDSKPQPKETLFKLYYLCFGLYAIAPICFFSFIIKLFVWPNSDLFFWVVFLLSILPSAILGFLLSIVSWRISIKRNEKMNIKVGRNASMIGGVGIFAGIIGWLILYVVVS